MRDGLGWVADVLEYLASKVRKGDERLAYWTSYAFRLEHELGEALHRARCPDCGKMVGAAGIEPAASAMSKQRSTADLRARDKTETRRKKKRRKIKTLMRPATVMSRSKGQANTRRKRVNSGSY